MPVDEGLRDTYLTRIRAEIQQRRELLGLVRERLRLVQFEDAAQKALTAAETQVLANVGFLDTETLDEIRLERDRLAAEIDAFQKLRDAVKGMV